MLSKQHEKQLEETESRLMDDDDYCGPLKPCSLGAGICRSLFEGIECNQNRSVREEDCDSFNRKRLILPWKRFFGAGR